MKKTVTINISGLVFTIDEDAYQKLNKYFETIKGYFKDSDGKEEIMADIEARVAEMLQEKKSDKKEVISIEDIDAVIAVMGQPEDYIDEETKANQQEEKQEYTSSSHNDPLPRSRRIYRDPDSNIIGGVCSGVGYFFGFDPLWLRIVFAIAFFGFGTGLLLYILLWIIIPEAKTTAEKLEMKGEPVNVDNIGKAVEEEINNLKNKFNDFQKTDGKQHAQKAKNIFQQVVDFITNLIQLIIKALERVIGLALILFGVACSIGFIHFLFGNGTLISINGASINTLPFSSISEYILTDNNHYLLALIGFVLLIGVPIFSFLFSGLKMVFGIKSKTTGVGISMVLIWLIGLISLGVLGLQLGQEFAQQDERLKSQVVHTTSDTLWLDIGEDPFKLKKKKRHKFHNKLLIKLENETLTLGNPTMDIIQSETDSFQIEIIYSSRGETNKEAGQLADNIIYNFSQTDSLFAFDPFYKIIDDNWRFQNVQINIHVPEGKSVYLSEKMDRIIHDIENTTDTWDPRMCGKTWTMLTDGLTCIGCDENEI